MFTKAAFAVVLTVICFQYILLFKEKGNKVKESKIKTQIILVGVYGTLITVFIMVFEKTIM